MDGTRPPPLPRPATAVCSLTMDGDAKRVKKDKKEKREKHEKEAAVEAVPAPAPAASEPPAVAGKKRSRAEAADTEHGGGAGAAAADSSATAGAAATATPAKKARRAALRGPMAAIAAPLADGKLRKRVMKLVEKAAASKVLKRGVKEVVKAVRKGDKGCVTRPCRRCHRFGAVGAGVASGLLQPTWAAMRLGAAAAARRDHCRAPPALRSVCIIAGDISPIDVISHLPVMCDDAEVPYVYVDSKAELGAAAATKRPTSVVLVAPGKKSKDFDAEALREVVSGVHELHKSGAGAGAGAATAAAVADGEDL